MQKSSGRQDYRSYHFSSAECFVVGAKAVMLVLWFSYFFYRSVWAFIPMLIIGAYVIREEKRKKGNRQREELAEQFQECLLTVSTLLRSGYASENAFLEARKDLALLYGEDALICRELAYMRGGLGINISLEELLTDLGHRSGIEETTQFAQVFAIAKRSGGNLPEMMASCAHLISRKKEAEREMQTLLSGKQMEQMLMRFMPFAIVLYVGKTYPGYFDPLYHNFTGVCIMTVCLLGYCAAYLMGNSILYTITRELDGKPGKQGGKVYEAPKKPAIAECMKKLAKKCPRLYSGSVKEDLKRLFPEADLQAMSENYLYHKCRLSGLAFCVGEFFTVVYLLQNGIFSQKPLQGLMWMLGVAAFSACLFVLSDRDLQAAVQKQKKRWKYQYPDLVHKLVLYLGAGLSLRGCFRRLATEYDLAKYTYRELTTGVSEMAAYENFGKRTGVLEYIRLGTLLSQNLKRGNADLLTRLSEEAYKASLEKIQTARKLSEEAGTKLLLPMMIYLAIVMVMIMLPAFMGLEL